jgi:predicted nucleic acid-binding protein
MQILLDSNILCRLARPDDPQHEIARQSVRTLLQHRHELIVAPQIEREFWVVATRPRANNGLGMTPDEADAHLTACAGFCSFMADHPAVHERWRRLVVDHDVKGKAAHDAGIVAAMQAHGISSILTFDASDFKRYENLIAVQTPSQHSGRDAIDR